MPTINKIRLVTRAEDAGNRRIKVVANSGDYDHENERVIAAGVDLSTFKRNPIVLWAHNYNQPPIGKVIDIGVKNSALVATMEFAETEFADTILKLYQGGYLRAVSVGIISNERQRNERGGVDHVRSTLVELSAVPVPADPQALALAVRQGVLSHKSYLDLADASRPAPSAAPAIDQRRIREEVKRRLRGVTKAEILRRLVPPTGPTREAFERNCRRDPDFERRAIRGWQERQARLIARELVEAAQ